MSDKKTVPYKIYIEESQMPTHWYNLRADMKNKPAPLLDPITHKPMGKEDLAGVFCDELIEQELDDSTAYYAIPEEIRSFYIPYKEIRVRYFLSFSLQRYNQALIYLLYIPLLIQLNKNILNLHKYYYHL